MIFKRLVLIVLVIITSSSFAKTKHKTEHKADYNTPEINNSSPVGYWKTIDDNTGAEKSIVQIEQNKATKKYTGKVVKILKLDEPGDPETKVCDKCEGSRHNKPIKGMTIMWGVEQDEGGSSFDGGEILDPKTGSIYRVKFELENNGKDLKVRGYMGISLLGRTQTWHRTNWTE